MTSFLLGAASGVPPAGAMVLANCFALQPNTTSVLLVTNVVDDSSSIDSYGNTEAVRRGYNESLATLAGDADSTRQILVSTLLINGGWLYHAKDPAKAPRLDGGNYVPRDETPLFPAVLTALGFVSQAADYLVERGISVYSITNVITDGADTTRQPPSIVRPVADRLQADGLHILAGIAVRDGRTDFHRVFTEMGIAEQWIKVLEREAGDIRAGLGTTLSAARATSTVSRVAFRATTSSGFGGANPGQGSGAASPSPPKVIVQVPAPPQSQPTPKTGGEEPIRTLWDAVKRAVKKRGG